MTRIDQINSHAPSQDKAQLKIKEFYKGKNVLLTGVTGFLGKVIFEKLLRSCPDINKFYIMVRPKRNIKPIDRIKTEILTSENFRVLKRMNRNFVEWAESKIVAIQGDLIMENLGLSEEDRSMVVKDCHVIINSAASVNFDDPLQDALQINYFGCQRMLQLAKECRRLEIFTHVSTCYVNCNRLGDIEEDIYDKDIDVELKVKTLMALNPQEIVDNLAKLLGKFPNTYTFTKNLAEKALLKNKGDLNVCLLRPSIIASSLEQPFPGWTDSLAAAGGISFLTGLGLINFIQAKGLNKFDMIPVDFVSNHIIVATAYGTTQPKKLLVYNCGTSSTNSITMGQYKDTMVKGFQFVRLNKQVLPVSLEFVKDPRVFRLKKWFWEEMPDKILDTASKIPLIGGKQMQKQVEQLKQIRAKSNNAVEIMYFFIHGDWRYINNRIYNALEMMSPEEQIEFQCDTKTIDWEPYLLNYIKGLGIWALNEDQIAPEHGYSQIIFKNKKMLDDFHHSFKKRENFKEKNSQIYERSILNEGRFYDFLQIDSSISGNKSAHKYKENEIKKELIRVRCQLQKAPTQFTFFILSKLMDHLLDGLHVDKKSLKNIKSMSKNNRKLRIVFMPIYKSYTDPLIMHYINFFADLELGFTFGNFEDSPKIGFVDRLLKRIGTLLIRRDPRNSLSAMTSKRIDSDVMNYVNQSLFQEVLEHNVITTLFQNDERIRSGKFNLPIFGENSIKLLLKSYNNLQKLKYDIKIVPVCINYDRLFEASYLANEMVSGKFTNINLFEMTSNIMKMRRGKLGKVFVKYAQPIDLSSYIATQKDKTFEQLSLNLTRHLYQIHQKEQPITMNSLISSSLFYQPEKQIMFKQVKKTSQMLYHYIQDKQYKNYISAAPQAYDIKEAALNLGFKVLGNPDHKKEGGNAIVDMREQANLLKNLSLAYYGNQLSVYMKAESIIAHSIRYVQNKNKTQSVTADQIEAVAKVIVEIFKNEFLPQQQQLDVEGIESVLKEQCRRGWYVKNQDSSYSVPKGEEQTFEFFKDLLQSYIDSYLVVVFTINALMENGVVIEQNKLVTELHIGMQEIFYSGAIKFMSSCLIEVLNTAFGRCSELGICVSQTYDSQQGGKIIYLSAPAKSKQTVEHYLSLLTSLSSSDEKGMHSIEKEVNLIIKRLQGPMARL